MYYNLLATTLITVEANNSNAILQSVRKIIEMVNNGGSSRSKGAASCDDSVSGIRATVGSIYRRKHHEAGSAFRVQPPDDA